MSFDFSWLARFLFAEVSLAALVLHSQYRAIVRFPKPGNFILNPGRKSVIELASKCGISPTLGKDPSSQSIKLDQILNDPLIIMHTEVLKLCFGFSFWIKRIKMATEFRDEFGVVGEPGDIDSRGQQWFKLVQHRPFEIGQCIGNLSAIIIRLVSKIKEALGQEGL